MDRDAASVLIPLLRVCVQSVTNSFPLKPTQDIGKTRWTTLYNNIIIQRCIGRHLLRVPILTG